MHESDTCSFSSQERGGQGESKTRSGQEVFGKTVSFKKKPKLFVAPKMLCSEHLAFSALSLKGEQGSAGTGSLFSADLAPG